MNVVDDSSIEPTKVTASDIEPEEKDRALAILESVVGPSVKDKKPKKHFKYVNYSEILLFKGTGKFCS